MSETTLTIPDLAALDRFAARVARVVRPGDVLVLTGELGAGKTTFTQHLASHMEVAGRVSSPTFVIARVHPALGAGPALVHVDAYRLDGVEEFDDLGLDAETDEVVTIVEWGRHVAKHLNEDHLEITLRRSDELADLPGVDAPVRLGDGGAGRAGTTRASNADEEGLIGEVTEDTETDPADADATDPSVLGASEKPGPSVELERFLTGHLDEVAADETRYVTLEATGPTWEERLPLLEEKRA